MKTISQKTVTIIITAVVALTMCFAVPVEALTQVQEESTVSAVHKASAVTDVDAEAITYNKIRVSWADWTLENDGFEIYRSTNKKGPYKKIKTINDWAQDTWNDTNVNVGTRYYYKIRSFTFDEEEIADEYGQIIDCQTVTNYSEFSGIVSAITKLAKPSLTVKSAGATKVKLSWNKVSGASGYKIYKYSSKKKKYIATKTIKNGSTKSWTNKKLKTGEKVKYKMRAYKKVGGKLVYSTYSKTKAVTPKAKKKTKTSSGGSVYITRTGTKYHRGSCRIS